MYSGPANVELIDGICRADHLHCCCEIFRSHLWLYIIFKSRPATSCFLSVSPFVISSLIFAEVICSAIDIYYLSSLLQVHRNVNA